MISIKRSREIEKAINDTIKKDTPVQIYLTAVDLGGMMVIIGITAFMVMLFQGNTLLIAAFSLFGGLFYHMGKLGLREVEDA